MTNEEIVEYVAKDYYLPGPTNLREAILRGIKLALWREEGLAQINARRTNPKGVTGQ